MSELVDTHCHLNFSQFDQDLADVIGRALDTGVEIILVPGSDLPSSIKSVELADRYDFIYAAVGFHPHYAADWMHNSYNRIAELAAHPKVVAVGEIGLDYYRNISPVEKQREAFHAQLEIAETLRLPVIIHNRDSTEDMMSIISNWYKRLKENTNPLAERPGVFHSFNQSLDIANTLIDMNFSLGISGPVTYPNAVELQQTVKSLPLSSILLETDAPYLSPQAHRGKRNEPAFIESVAQKIAFLHNIPVEDVAQVTKSNAERTFAWS